MGNDEANRERNHPSSDADEYQLQPGDSFTTYFEHMHEKAVGSRESHGSNEPAIDKLRSNDPAEKKRSSRQLLTPATSPVGGREALDRLPNQEQSPRKTALGSPRARNVAAERAEGTRQSPTTQVLAREQLSAVASELAIADHKDAASFLNEISKNGAGRSKQETLRLRHVVFNLTASGDQQAATSVRDAYKALRSDTDAARRLDPRPPGGGRQI